MRAHTRARAHEFAAGGSYWAAAGAGDDSWAVPRFVGSGNSAAVGGVGCCSRADTRGQRDGVRALPPHCNLSTLSRTLSIAPPITYSRANTCIGVLSTRLAP
jgi:hypothetical protein